LSIFIHNILNRSILPTDTAVREWLKPSSATGSPLSLVGMPWEIYRAPDLTPNHPHTIDLYGKGGAAYGYHNQMAVIDELGVGVVVMTAGSANAANIIYDAVLTALVPALDEVARLEAKERFVGTYDNVGSGSGVPFNVTVGLDNDSMVLAGVHRNGTDMLASYLELWGATVGRFLEILPTLARIFPVDVITEDTISRGDGTENAVLRQDWRIEWEMGFAGSTDLPGAGPEGLSSRNCLGWSLTDWLYYGNEALDRIVFVTDKVGGEILGVEVPFLRSGLLKKT
jgi:hypothetical protein